jgi:hypothetical protein
MHIYEVIQVVVEFKRELQTSLVSKNTTYTCCYIRYLNVFKIRDMAGFDETNQEHLPHGCGADRDKVRGAEIVREVYDYRCFHCHFGLLPSYNDHIIDLRF